MKTIKDGQSALVSDNCSDCGSYADIGAVIDEHDTKLLAQFSGDDAQSKADSLAEKAKTRFDDIDIKMVKEADIVQLEITFAYSAEKMIFQLENSI